ncbi:hypothetical protein [Chryseobacterium sp. SIMBA_029]|uniref:hypothetical protein n=1 Tax=Chryseobacterium sp. SIMBA_029 TaxID=3085772 RepID=UPI00397DDD69
MKKIILLAMSLISGIAYSQVGINTASPKATLDVTGMPGIATLPDGVIAPRLTGNQLAAKDAAYGIEQIGTLVYATAAVTVPTVKTANVTQAGYYMFDGTKWGYTFGGSNTGTIAPGQLVYYHGTITNATSTNNWMNSYLSDLPVLDGIVRLDGIFLGSSVNGSGSASFNPRLVNVSGNNQKIWVAEISSVDRFNFANVILGSNGGWINIDNGIYLNYGDNMTTASVPYGLTGGTPYNNSNEVVALDIIVNSKWFRCYYFLVIDNKNQTAPAGYTREVYLSIQRLY